MKWVGLTHPELRRSAISAALVLMALTWIPLFVLCIFEGLAFGRVKIPFFYDIAAHTRFLVAVPLLILAEIPIGSRLQGVMRHLIRAHLVRNDELRKFADIVLSSLRFRDSHLGETVVILLAYLAT